VSITNADGAGAYPISSYTWILMYERPSDKVKARKMVEFMRWAITDGEAYAKDLGYAPLPEAVVKLEQDALGKIQVQ
jgi:phosphate transport system substrate-binding protein